MEFELDDCYLDIENLECDGIDFDITLFEVPEIEIDCDLAGSEESEMNTFEESLSMAGSGKEFLENEDTMMQLQKEFVGEVEKQEERFFGISYVRKYFTYYGCSAQDVLRKTRTQLWLENSIFGIQFQAFLCSKFDIELPVVQKRNRKKPISAASGKMKKFKSNSDKILEELVQKCRQISFKPLQRQAPRNQVSLVIFLLDILSHPYFAGCIIWEDANLLTFEITNPKAIAYYWMTLKENDTCNFENFARGIRYKRNCGLFKHVKNKRRRIYQFNHKAIEEYLARRAPNSLTKILKQQLYLKEVL